MKRNKKILVLTIIGAVLIYVIVFFRNAMIEASRNPIVMEKNAPIDYLNLFNEDARGKLSLALGTSFKGRSNISIFTYDKKYSLEITKIKTNLNFDLENDLIEYYNKPNGSFPKIEWHYNEANFITKYNAESLKAASKIFLSIQGDSVKTITKNDSLVFYYLKLKDACFQYDRNGVYEVSIETKAKLIFFKSEQPVSLMFIKGDNSLYFLLLTANDDSTILNPNLLQQLLYKK